jgi:hypothetical protein
MIRAIFSFFCDAPSCSLWVGSGTNLLDAETDAKQAGWYVNGARSFCPEHKTLAERECVVLEGDRKAIIGNVTRDYVSFDILLPPLFPRVDDAPRRDVGAVKVTRGHLGRTKVLGHRGGDSVSTVNRLRIERQQRDGGKHFLSRVDNAKLRAAAIAAWESYR